MKNTLLFFLTIIVTTTNAAQSTLSATMAIKKQAFLPYDSVYFQNQVVNNPAEAIPVQDIQGKTIPIAETGIRYYPVSPYVSVMASKDNKFGLINKQGKLLLNPKYRRVVQYTPERLGFDEEKYDEWQLFDRKGKPFAPYCHYVEGVFRGQVAVCRIDEGKRLIDLDSGSLLSDSYALFPAYNNVDKFNQYGVGIVSPKASLNYCVINVKGEEVVPCQYSSIELLNNGLIAVEDQDLWGMYDTEGNSLVKPQYSSLRLFRLSERLQKEFVIYEVDDRQGILDKQAREVTPPKYENISQMANPNVVELVLNGKKDYLNLKTMQKVAAAAPEDTTEQDAIVDEIIQGVYTLSDAIGQESGAAIKSTNSLGEELRGFAKMQALEDYMEQYARSFEEMKYYPRLNVLTYFRNKNNYGIIGNTGRRFALSQYQNSALLANNLFAVKKKVFRWLSLSHEVKWGAIDRYGDKVIPFEYDNLVHLTTKRFFAKQGAFWGIIDATGEAIVEPIFTRFDVLSDNAVLVENEAGLIGFFSRESGELVIPLQYSALLQLFDYQGDTYATVKTDKGVGLINLEIPKVVIEPSYQAIALKEGIIQVYDGSQWQDIAFD